jgi:hypothetical protein
MKRKGPDPGHRQQQQQQPSQQGKTKRHGGRQEKERQERRATKQEQHDHSYFTWPAQTMEVVEPIMAPTFINASQPSRAAPVHSSVASFGKNGIEYRKVPPAAPSKPTPSESVWPLLNRARDICDSLQISKTAKNLKPLEAPIVNAPIKPTADPFEQYRKAQKAVNKMVTKPEASSSKGKAKLVERITTPPFEDRDVSREPPVSLGDSQEDPYTWDESDDSDGAPR